MRLSALQAFSLNPAYGNGGYLASGDDLAQVAREGSAAAPAILEFWRNLKQIHCYYMCSLRSLANFKTADWQVAEIEARVRPRIPDFTIVHAGGIAVQSDHLGEKSAVDAKGQLELALLARSASGFLHLEENESWGKLMEAAMMVLLYQRPVIIFASESMRTLLQCHPLRLIGTARASRGFHITSSFETAAKCLVNSIRGETSQELVPRPNGWDIYCDDCHSLIERRRRQ